MDLSRIIVALDDPQPTVNQAWLEKLQGRISRVKIGSVAFSAQGPQIIEEANRQGYSVFLDLKFHDIPNTVAKAVEGLLHNLDMEFFTVHALGGSKMIQAVRKVLDDSTTRASMLAVTMLTSHDASDVQELGFQNSLEQQVLNLGNLSINSGAHGVVCSAFELPSITKQLGSDVTYMVPGIRLPAQDHGDQTRVATPAQAFEQGASFVVMGRGITASEDPMKVLDQLERIS